MAKILIIDDEPAMVEVISNLCRDRGHQAFPFSSSESALDALPRIDPQLVIVDVKMEKVGGFDVLRECRERFPNTTVIMITAYASVETAVEAMKMGAYDYITKPFKIDELQLCVQRALDYQATLRENSQHKREIRDRYKFENLVGTSSRMQEIYKLIGKVADTESTILIQGEGGTGKELVARALHYNSSRQHLPFVTVNCSALPDSMLESELFGHKKGAFAGAVIDKIGLFEEANHGTLFFDEVNSMSLQLQTKLLRVLQERQIRRIGDTRNIPINVRAIAASVEPLKTKIRGGAFREDLYYRLAVIPVEIPPLRERIEDIPLLAQYFLQRYAMQSVTEQKKIDPKALEQLMRYGWPGNVRELENVIERASALCEGGIIKSEDLPAPVLYDRDSFETISEADWQVGQPLDNFVRAQERKYIELTLKFNQGSREKTASMLGISIATLYRKLDLKHHKA
jgi:two-component system, NtrC family, response regulator AtoC